MPQGETTPADIRKLAPVFGEFADALEKLSPPADVRSYHEALVEAARVSASQLAAYQRGHEDPFGPVERWYLPSKIGHRLEAVAAKNPDCTKDDFHFDRTHPFFSG